MSVADPFSKAVSMPIYRFKSITTENPMVTGKRFIKPLKASLICVKEKFMFYVI